MMTKCEKLPNVLWDEGFPCWCKVESGLTTLDDVETCIFVDGIYVVWKLKLLSSNMDTGLFDVLA